MTRPRALLSVTDKTGIVAFATALRDAGYALLSTGGTARTLEEAGLPVLQVSSITGFPEILDGRVKTLHPAIHGAILARDTKPHREAIASHGINAIDLVCVNLYRFEAVAEGGHDWNALIEEIDIGGPAMIRAAAKNCERVTVVTDPGQYALVLDELRAGGVREGTRRRLAVEAFRRTAAYDAVIAEVLARRADQAATYPDRLTLTWSKVSDLRYGENPHQSAALYREPAGGAGTLASATILGGKAMSFNNYLDADAAIELVREFDAPAVVIVKHANPCGCAVAADLAAAYQGALAGDPVSAFGGIVACNRPLDARAATLIAATFFEVVAAPAFAPDALAILAAKKNLRLLELGPHEPIAGETEIRRISGGVLAQRRNAVLLPREEPRVVTRRAPGDSEWSDLRFAWTVCKHVKSNAIVLARHGRVLGVGAGQMSRVDSVKLALAKAGDAARGAVLASDAFFPFADGVEAAVQSGVSAILQPGGSVRDAEVIAAADAAGAAMAFTGMRHFRH